MVEWCCGEGGDCMRLFCCGCVRFVDCICVLFCILIRVLCFGCCGRMDFGFVGLFF